MGVSDSTKNAEVDPRTASASSAMDSDVTNLNESAGTDSDVTDPNQSAGTDSAAPEKPLKSILKKRKPERIPEETNAEHQNVEPPAKIPKGGSITEALKLITAIADESDDEAEDDSNPKPSAFILEMEKQKAQQSALSSGPVPSPNIPTCTPNPIGTDQYLEAFVVRQANQNVKVSQVNVGTQQFRRKRSALTPYDDVIEGVILITNLPFKATKDEILSILGICPKGGKDGIRLILERSALPAGFAYVIVERHSDMMDLLRLNGLKWQGRKLKFSKSSRDNLIRDWKITKVALAELDKSRVVQVKKLPFFLKKYRLIDALDGINIGPEDIYWQPLRPEQTNSGRGFIVLSSSEEAKKVNSRKFSLAGWYK